MVAVMNSGVLGEKIGIVVEDFQTSESANANFYSETSERVLTYYTCRKTKISTSGSIGVFYNDSS